MHTQQGEPAQKLAKKELKQPKKQLADSLLAEN
jgi:hypothetical protein